MNNQKQAIKQIIDENLEDLFDWQKK